MSYFLFDPNNGPKAKISKDGKLYVKPSNVPVSTEMANEDYLNKYGDLTGVEVTNPDGSVEKLTSVEAARKGLSPNPASYGTGSSSYYKNGDMYTNDLSQIANVSMDENTGKITVTVPDKWQDDDVVNGYIDNYLLETLSKNYKANKDVEYQDPYDETKKIKTNEYIDKINEGLKLQIGLLEAEAPTKTALISAFGGNEGKNAAINGLSTEDIIIMNLDYSKDDSWIPLPAYMELAYPELKKLETYKNGYVQRKDFLDNFYNIEDGKITERFAYGIATAPNKVLSNVEGMDPEEIARTVAFGNFISEVDPKRSNWQQFLQAGDALSRGFYGALFDYGVDTTNLVINAANFSWANGESLDSREFYTGLLGGDLSEDAKTAMQQMAYTNKDALSKAQAGYVQGMIAGKAVDAVVSMVIVGELTHALTTKLLYEGATKVASGMEAATGASKATGVATAAQNTAANTAAVSSISNAVTNAAKGSSAYRAFFYTTLNEAGAMYSKAVGGTTAVLQSMNIAQLTNAVNSAAKIAKTIQWANTAMDVVGSLVISAVVANKDLTTKVLSNKATSDEAKEWIQEVMWDAAKWTAISQLTGIAIDKFGPKITNTNAWKKFMKAKDTISQKATKVTTKFSHPWLKFMNWWLNGRKAAKAATSTSNATAASQEALKEAILTQEARQYGINLSTEQGSFGASIIEEALAQSGIEAGVNMADTLDKLAKAGIILDPSSLGISEYAGWQADFAELQNVLTGWSDVSTNVSQVVGELTSPDIQPTVSQDLSEVNNANADLLDAEQKAGLLDKDVIKSNKGILKEDAGYIYSMHSPALSRYIVRRYELTVIANSARIAGITNLESYKPYTEALDRVKSAAEAVPEHIRELADTKYVPALAKAEHDIVDLMMNDEVYPRAFVEAMRSNGKFGENGKDWMRLVAKRDIPKGVYNPFSKTVKRDNTIELGNFKVLDDEDITWPGNGLQELINEYAIARAEKKFLETSKKATGLTTDVAMSGEKTAAAGKMEEFRGDLIKATKNGFRSFTEDVEGTMAIGKKRAIERKDFYNEVATTGGISSIDIDVLRSVMEEKGLPLSQDVVDQKTLNEFYAKSSEQAKKIITDTLGEKLSTRVVDDYQEDVSLGTLNKRDRIVDIEKELKQLENDSIIYYAGLKYKENKLSKDLTGEAREKAKQFRQEKMNLGKKAAKRMGFTGKTQEEFAQFYKDKVAALEKEMQDLRNEVSDVRGSLRDTIKFDGNLYPDTSAEYISSAKTRQEISDKYLGKFMSSEGGLADDWLNSGELDAKAKIREKIESTPELRNALLSTMYANSATDLPYEEWLKTPMVIKRQQLVDSLRPEDAFLSFSMRDDWQGISSLVDRQATIQGDIISLEIRPMDTLGEIPKGAEAEDLTELEVLVPREAYATAMANYEAAGGVKTSDPEYMEILENSQYNKLQEMRENNTAEYENFLEKLDRANAVDNPEIRSSEQVQVAAEEYRNNATDLEKSTIFQDDFSYLIENLKAPKGTLRAFVEENNLELPDDKRPFKSKVKHALWEKVINNEELPAIKGLKKADINRIYNEANAITLPDTGDEVSGSDKKLDEIKKQFYTLLDETELFKNSEGASELKFDIDEETFNADIDDAINGMMELIKQDTRASLAVNGMNQYRGVADSNARFEFTVLNEVLSKEGSKEFEDTIKGLSRKIVDGLIPRTQMIIKGNQDALYKKVESIIRDKLEMRLAAARAELASLGEPAESETITELIKKYKEELNIVEADELVVKTTDKNGEIQYERVSPTIASIYNERPIYTPVSTPQQILSNLALLKKINTTDLSPRSFMKQAVSDPAMAFSTVGVLPGTLQALRTEIELQFGPAVLQTLEKVDPIRYENILKIAAREGISREAALMRNMEAIAKTQIPFTLLNQEILRQANISKYGNKEAMRLRRKNLNQKINSGLRKVSDKLGWLQNKRESYVRLLAGEKAYLNALRRGYGVHQAEIFREHAINTATTNFRIKHTMFNRLRSSVPYLTSGISGAKSFWKMFEMDPVGVSSRIFTGFVIPIIYFMGEIVSDEELKKKYEALAESEKSNHIVIAIGNEIILIPVGEEIGQYVNIITHMVEALNNENKYDFWNLMLNDMVGLIPGADLTGFTDPEMWNNISGEAPTFMEVMENGIGKVLASTAPPIAQSEFMIRTGRDLYTGRKVNTSYITIDENGNPVVMTTSTSEFAKAIANAVGGDARVIEKVVSNVGGPTFLHTLDSITSAVQFIGSGGEEGSLTTAIEKTAQDISKPFAPVGYDTLEKRWSSTVSELYDMKDKIIHDDPDNNLYIKYNREIAKETDPKRRQDLINKRNDLLTEYLEKVGALVDGYRTAGGTLDKEKFSTAVSLIVFEDAARADRQYMSLNTNYGDAYKQAMQTLYDMGIQNPEGPSSLGYIYTDDDGNPQVKMWTPTQIQIVSNAIAQQGNIYKANIEAIINDGTENSIKNQRKLETQAEQPYWDKYNATGKLTDAEWDAIDDLRAAFNEKVVLALKGYIDSYGAENVLSQDAVIDYLNDIIKVPSEYERVNGRYVSSGGGKLNKQSGFAESYIKSIFGVKK